MTLLDEYALTRTAAATSTIVPTLEDVEGSTPNITTAAYERSVPRWAKCRALMQGTEAIRAGGTTYLPQHPSEPSSRYEIRRVIAALFNGFARTVAASVGLICEPEPTLGDDMPQPLVDLWESVDGAGTHGAVFTQKLVKSGLVDGLAGIITEYPRIDDPKLDRSKASLAATEAVKTGAQLDASDTAALGLRPYFILVKADQVRLALYEAVNGKRTLVLLILEEIAATRKGLFGLKDVKRYRVYSRSGDQVTYELWTEETSGTPTRTEGPTVMRNIMGIPWSPLPCGDELSPGEYKPTLMDLADLNIEHHQIKTGILSLEDLACVPTPVRVGAQPDANGDYPALVLGPSNTIEAPATQGVSTPVYWLAPPVDVLAPAKESLENCKAEMGAMGASFLAPQPAVAETATAKRLDDSAERASVTSVSRTAKDCLESAFGFAGQYINERAGSVTMADVTAAPGLDPTYLAVLVSAFQAGALDIQELRYVIQTGKLPEDFEAADVLELVGRQIAKEDAEKARIAAMGNPDPAVAA